MCSRGDRCEQEGTVLMAWLLREAIGEGLIRKPKLSGKTAPGRNGVQQS